MMLEKNIAYILALPTDLINVYYISALEYHVMRMKPRCQDVRKQIKNHINGIFKKLFVLSYGATVAFA